MDHTLPVIDKINAMYGVIIALFSYAFGTHWKLFAFFLALNFGDYFTRWLAARITKTENSKAGWIGILKKLGYWVMIALGFGMGAIFIELGNTIGIDLQITTFIGWFVLAALITNEIRSILENLVEARYKIPNILIKGLEVANKAIDGTLKISDDGIEIESHLTHDELQAKGKATMTIEDIRSRGNN